MVINSQTNGVARTCAIILQVKHPVQMSNVMDLIKFAHCEFSKAFQVATKCFFNLWLKKALLHQYIIVWKTTSKLHIEIKSICGKSKQNSH